MVVSSNYNTLLISWSPPFTLEGVPILGYNVTITNTTSGLELETENTTMLNYTFIIDHPDPDNNFTVTVVSINGAGPGDPASKIIRIIFPTPSESLKINFHVVVCFTQPASASTFSSTKAGTSLPMPPVSSSMTMSQCFYLLHYNVQ